MRRMTFFPRTRWLMGNLNWAMILTLTAHCEEGEEHIYMVRDIRAVYHIFKSHMQV